MLDLVSARAPNEERGKEKEAGGGPNRPETALAIGNRHQQQVAGPLSRLPISHRDPHHQPHRLWFPYLAQTPQIHTRMKHSPATAPEFAGGHT
jgi:hypothetical protein